MRPRDGVAVGRAGEYQKTIELINQLVK